MELQIIDRSLVRELLPMETCIGLMETAMLQTAAGATCQPPRWIIGLPSGRDRGFGLMPGAMLAPDVFGAKLTAVYPENGARGLQSHQGAIVLFDAAVGTPVAIVHGGEVTAIRTAAASGLATRVLSSPEAGDLAILGCGEQAREHLLAMSCVRSLRRVRIWGRDSGRAEAFARENAARSPVPIEICANVTEAVRDADLICTVTAAAEPILENAQVADGTHINVVGSSIASAAEIGNTLVQRARFFVDYRPSALLQAGEFLAAKEAGLVTEDHILAETGEVLAGRHPGRQAPGEVTIYKSLGIPAEDLICANHLFQTARQRNLGARVPF
ncbi:ornithine cyclodeaminase/alanine dehydrogenase-like protein (mu-crystallin family) [Mesorhizobium soli]|uniref:ornithine cyclodeaminase family protein n=1 Tax=Pseudaminobacter soli (ex Li et al. 2025) TaxID=1295366 RepID=UPI0024763852|nr:ornithine cyclodeaminase family protein [Mesorhizobium soli]MDH6231772.1 ornithine cyclodeaminase/alanine dehydrogenase-like protein (mu-crystallin family) [Mesorhizobium soli]